MFPNFWEKCLNTDYSFSDWRERLGDGGGWGGCTCFLAEKYPGLEVLSP